MYVCLCVCVSVYVRRLKSRGMMWSLRSEIRDISLCFDIYPNSNVPQTSLKPAATRPWNEKLKRDRAHPLPRYTISPFILSPFRRHEEIATDVPWQRIQLVRTLTIPDYTQTVRLVDFESTRFSRALRRRLRSNIAKNKMFFLIT